ncbi:MAG: hypothetical protein O3B01_20300 [Planctomycetota bacterium]|nr:hypothetical protein [Planctomycetota bacterium]
MKAKSLCSVHLLVLVACTGLLGEATSPQQPPKAVHDLADFGDLDSPQKIKFAFQAAVEALGKTGGILTIPSGMSQFIDPELASQELERIPPLPENTRTWRSKPGITIIESNEQQVMVQVPQIEGLKISRTLRTEEGNSLPHWGTHPMVTMENKLVFGSSSYLDWLQFPVEKGKERRFYLPTIRGIRVGQFLNAHGGPGYGGGVNRAYVKSLGYDKEKKMSYFVADTELDHLAGAIIHNKSNTGIIHSTQTSNSDNQTYDVKVIRNQYAHGDTYVYYCDFNYMSNVHSAAGDENGHCYSAFTRSLGNNFQGVVETVDWSQGHLKFRNGARNIHTLGDSRPLINMNNKKWVTQGKVLIVPAESYWDLIDSGKFPFQGKTYPTTLEKDPKTGVTGIKMGGLIRGDADCPWTDAIVGRYFALTDQGEMVPGSNNHRWYLITEFRTNADGTKELEIERFWWGAKSAASPTLYSLENATWDGHLRPLSYAIAPGTYVNDVSRALPGGNRGGQQIVAVTPYLDQGSALDFEAGDQIEQAIGPDPFKPQIFRSWMWDNVPGAWPSAVFDVANFGEASRYALFVTRGGPDNLDDVSKRQEKKPAWDNFFIFESSANVGINYKADFADAAILFQQPNREQPIKWHFGHEKGKPAKEATLTVDRDTGTLNFQGGGIQANGAISGASGISAESKPAKNLRGKNVPVEAGATETEVRFPVEESDSDYAAFVEQTWLTNRAVTKQTAKGFVILFDKPAPAKAKLHWMIVR